MSERGEVAYFARKPNRVFMLTRPALQIALIGGGGGGGVQNTHHTPVGATHHSNQPTAPCTCISKIGRARNF